MEYNYKGIKPESIELLCLNRFNDSKPFYEEHKEELKQGITVPLRQMVLDMSDVLFDIDDKMYLDPVRVHSRIHRDTRGNRSKIKYRENMWVFFRRYKKEYPCAPFYYFEFYPNCYGYGLVFWTWKASDFRLVHQMIVEQPQRFRKALKACEDAGADGISLINTLLGMRIDLRRKKPVIANVMGGFSGPAIFPVALRMVYQVASAVSVPVIGMGGVSTADDVIEMMLAGATAVEVGAANLVDPFACKDIIDSLPEAMQKYGINNLNEIIGGAQNG